MPWDFKVVCIKQVFCFNIPHIDKIPLWMYIHMYIIIAGLLTLIYIPALITYAESELAEQKRLCECLPALDTHHLFIWQSWSYMQQKTSKISM